jgi:hypothetical protein
MKATNDMRRTISTQIAAVGLISALFAVAWIFTDGNRAFQEILTIVYYAIVIVSAIPFLRGMLIDQGFAYTKLQQYLVAIVFGFVFYAVNPSRLAEVFMAASAEIIPLQAMVGYAFMTFLDFAELHLVFILITMFGFGQSLSLAEALFEKRAVWFYVICGAVAITEAIAASVVAFMYVSQLFSAQVLYGFFNCIIILSFMVVYLVYVFWVMPGLLRSKGDDSLEANQPPASSHSVIIRMIIISFFILFFLELSEIPSLLNDLISSSGRIPACFIQFVVLIAGLFIPSFLIATRMLKMPSRQTIVKSLAWACLGALGILATQVLYVFNITRFFGATAQYISFLGVFYPVFKCLIFLLVFYIQLFRIYRVYGSVKRKGFFCSAIIVAIAGSFSGALLSQVFHGFIVSTQGFQASDFLDGQTAMFYYSGWLPSLVMNVITALSLILLILSGISKSKVHRPQVLEPEKDAEAQGRYPSFSSRPFAARRAHTSTDDIAAQIVEALDTHDRQVLIDLFSEQALKEADDLEVGMDYMFAFYRGESIAMTTYGASTSDHYGENQRMQRMRVEYLVETTQDIYYVFFDLYFIHEENSQKVGLYSLGLLAEAEMNVEDFTNPIGFAPGIYYPGRSDEYQRTPEYQVTPNPRARQ